MQIRCYLIRLLIDCFLLQCKRTTPSRAKRSTLKRLCPRSRWTASTTSAVEATAAVTTTTVVAAAVVVDTVAATMVDTITAVVVAAAADATTTNATTMATIRVEAAEVGTTTATTAAMTGTVEVRSKLSKVNIHLYHPYLHPPHPKYTPNNTFSRKFSHTCWIMFLE